MLAIPEAGFARSIAEHNVRLDAMCDWLEGSILFRDERIDAPDVVDALCEGQIYRSQDFAWEMVSTAWRELGRRAALLRAGTPFSVARNSVSRTCDWTEVTGHGFCVALALAAWFPKWASSFGSDYTEQGILFESIAREAVECLFREWEVYPTGWSRSNPVELQDLVEQIAARLGEARGNVEKWTTSKAHEAGVDLLCYRPFHDGRGGLPTYLMQCASGRNWDSKLHTPCLSVWRKLIDFAAEPAKAFATPYALLDSDFPEKCIVVNGLLLDRYRLLQPARDNRGWVSPVLAARLKAWLAPRIQELPYAEE
ncbi:MAG: hypothetical protein FJ291_18160 [Planctomycetes bacterium]|nr:hypothetical protein [Planctomycetota bacterium]